MPGSDGWHPKTYAITGQRYDDVANDGPASPEGRGEQHMDAAERYNAMVDARQRQQARLSTPFGESYWERFAHTYRFDPNRLPEMSIREIIRRMEMEDEIIEVGGGAGRVGLPLVLRGKSLRNVEPSAAMREQFRLSVWQHEIENAEAIDSAWPMSDPIRADLVVTADVTYFISDIEPFLRAMHEAAKRRVAILTWTVPPPNVNGELFRLAFGEAEAPSPGFRELVPVLWEMGIVPDVLVIEEGFAWPERRPTNDEEALQFVYNELSPLDEKAVAERLRPRLGELFMRDDAYFPTWRTPSRAMLITWRTD